MPVYAEFSKDGFKAIEIQTDIATQNVITVSAAELAEAIRLEMPWASLRDDVRVIPAVKTPKGAVAQIIIGSETGSNDFIWELWKGNVERIHTAHNTAMKFSNWPNGPDELRAPDGFYYFRRVKHPASEGNDFIGRAIDRFKARMSGLISSKFASYFAGFSKGRAI